VEGQENDLRTGVQHSPGRPAVRFNLTNYSRCDRLKKSGFCEYSHDEQYRTS